ncbi:putative HTH-type transcriptional regulator [Microbacterium lemovicicum]|uniref:Putative HTH-type transcriptional regulator n=2 Tax=Microbacterium lemovicicum TaxID=1072463 RepID=A0A3Q9J117_9MICO|nr:putative HTH-type transcriptional regulator [Microbacterium lemovicicum]
MYPVPRMSPAEGEAWLGLIRVCELLPSELDSQLQRDADMTHYEFAVLTFLRWAPDASVSMSEIADATSGSLSRLSHVCSRLERRGLISRSPSPEDRRVTTVALTGAGRRALIRAIPGHIETARRLVVDALSEEDLAHLARITALLGAQLDPESRFGSPR